MKENIIVKNAERESDINFNEILNPLNTNLLSTVQEKYKSKKNLIENADDMSTQEKLDAMDKASDHLVRDVLIVSLVLILAAEAVSGGKIRLSDLRKVFKLLKK